MLTQLFVVWFAEVTRGVFHIFADFVRIVHVTQGSGFARSLRARKASTGRNKYARIRGLSFVEIDVRLGIKDPADFAGKRVF